MLEKIDSDEIADNCEIPSNLPQYKTGYEISKNMKKI